MDKILQFLAENKDALTAVGIILTFLVSTTSLYFSVRNNKAVHYVNSVTKNRIEWIEKLRNNIARFIALSDAQTFINNFLLPEEMLKANFDESIKSVCQVGEEIKLLLNFTDQFDRELILKIDLQISYFKLICIETQNAAIRSLKQQKSVYVPEDKVYELQIKMEQLAKEITRDAQIYLKAEWNRVKYESQGKIYEKATQEFDIKELEEKYKNTKYKNDVWKRSCIDLNAKCRRIKESAGFAWFVFCLGIVILAMYIIA